MPRLRSWQRRVHPGLIPVRSAPASRGRFFLDAHGGMWYHSPLDTVSAARSRFAAGFGYNIRRTIPVCGEERILTMNIVCLDLEGVLVPEIWIAFSEASGIPDLRRTTRDEPDYDKLMRFRLNILREHNLGLKDIQRTIATIDPMPGAKEFLDTLRSETQVLILSDTFTQFASPLMEKIRVPQSKLTTVKALQSIGFDTIASGDSYNDLGMIQASKAGFLFRSTEQIQKDHPELPACETYEELLSLIRGAL